jgi:hypothetical protein
MALQPRLHFQLPLLAFSGASCSELHQYAAADLILGSRQQPISTAAWHQLIVRLAGIGTLSPAFALQTKRQTWYLRLAAIIYSTLE